MLADGEENRRGKPRVRDARRRDDGAERYSEEDAMPTYKAPVDDVLFLLNDVFHIERYNNLPGFADASPDVVEAILGEAAKFCRGGAAAAQPRRRSSRAARATTTAA